MTDMREAARNVTKTVLEAASMSVLRGRRHECKPYWNTKLQQLRDQASAAKQAIETNPADTNIIEHNKQQALFRKEKLSCIRSSWKKGITQYGKGNHKIMAINKMSKR